MKLGDVVVIFVSSLVGGFAVVFGDCSGLIILGMYMLGVAVGAYLLHTCRDGGK